MRPKAELVIVTVAAAAAMTGCEPLSPPEVQYYVDASDPVDITISGSGESTEQYSVSSLPWRYQFTASEGDFVYVSAQVGEYGGWVETRITVDGDTLDEARSQGDFVIATSSGSAR